MNTDNYTLVALPVVHCGDRPILLWKPPGTQPTYQLIRDWWKQSQLPLPPTTPQEKGTRQPLWDNYWQECNRWNKLWASQGIITLPSDFVMRWQRSCANWLIVNHGYTEQPVAILQLKDIY